MPSVELIIPAACLGSGRTPTATLQCACVAGFLATQEDT